MAKNSVQKGLFEIYLPPSAESKTLNNLDSLLNNKDELMFDINQNIHNLTREQLKYLKSLLNLDVSVFENEKLNRNFVGNPLFFYVARYNLYEGVLRTLKQMDKIDPNQIDVSIGLPDRNWLNIWAHTKILAFSLLEIAMYPEVIGVEESGIEITIYNSKGYTCELEKTLTKNYEHQGKEKDEIVFRLEENKQKREITKCVANEIVNYWNIYDFEENVSYDEKVKGKILPWARVYKENIDD
ncbi:MAG: hypothetical protein J6D28_00125 [Bacilli bacterium]|nr:hypothetical protein [Bacilli bacterium]